MEKIELAGAIHNMLLMVWLIDLVHKKFEIW